MTIKPAAAAVLNEGVGSADGVNRSRPPEPHSFIGVNAPTLPPDPSRVPRPPNR